MKGFFLSIADCLFSSFLGLHGIDVTFGRVFSLFLKEGKYSGLKYSH